MLKKKQALERDRRGVKAVTAIPTSHMDAYIAEMRRRLVEKRIGAKREFLQEVLKEVRVRGSNIILTYKLPLRATEIRFFTPLKLVEAGGECKELFCTISFHLDEHPRAHPWDSGD